MDTLSRRRFTAAVSATALGAACAPANAARFPHVVVSWGTLEATNAPLWYAADVGLFFKHGLDVELRYIGNGGQTSALTSGVVRLALAGGPEVLGANAAGADLLILATLTAGALTPGGSDSTLAGRRVWVSANRPIVQRFVDGLVDGIQYARQDEPYTISLLQKYFRTKDTRTLTATYDDVVLRIPLEPYARPAQFGNLRSVDVAQMIDDSFVREAATRANAR